MMRSLRSHMQRFGREDGGNLMVEAIVVLPFMLWSYVALFVYWDAFETINTVQKATYTVSDILSREMLSIDDSYITGMRDVVEYLSNEQDNVDMRVSSVTWNEADEVFEVNWSISPDNRMSPLTNENIVDQAFRIPDMSDGDFVVIVEAEVDYEPVFNVGVSDMTIEQFIVTRPRFVPRICLNTVACT